MNLSEVRFDPDAAEDLVRVVQELSMVKELPAVQDIVKRAARRLLRADGATVVLREGPMCFYADEDSITPLWKGKRFPMEFCISGWVMCHRSQVVIPDVFADDRIPHDVYRTTFVRSMAMVPIRTVEPLGAIGAYWSEPHDPEPKELKVLQALADSAAQAVESVRLWEGLEARTAELQEANHRLRAEVAERERAEARVRQISITDELTGLRNRRGFMFLAGAAHRSGPRHRERALVVFCDLDGLKDANDRFGHDQGDRLIVAVAEVLRGCFRDGDILARIGGDEFAVYVPNTADDGGGVVRRIEAAIGRRNVREDLAARIRLSIGVVTVDPHDEDPLEALLTRADAAMYEHKHAKR